MPTDYGQLPKIIRYYALVFRQIISKFAFWKWSKILLKQNFDISKYPSLFLLRWSALAVVVILLISLVFPLSSLAAFNQQINYQAKLTTTAGSTVPDDARSTVFSLYTASSGGTAIWTETQSVTTTDGLFSVMLGSVTSLAAVDFNQTLYLGVNVAGDGEMTPRKIIGAVPAAFNADRLDNL